MSQSTECNVDVDLRCPFNCLLYMFLPPHHLVKYHPNCLAVQEGWITLPFIVICPLPCSLFVLVRWISSAFSAAKQEPFRRAEAPIRGISSSCILLKLSSADVPAHHRKKFGLDLNLLVHISQGYVESIKHVGLYVSVISDVVLCKSVSLILYHLP